jgi:hypothetical protein
MTASRRNYTTPVSDQFRLAGSRLGLDLAGLFEEDEETGENGLGGFVPSMTTRALNKSRGNVLTYRPQPRSSSITEFSLTPEQASGSSSTETETEQPEKIFQGDVGGVSYTDIGEQGFGLKDYNVALEAGYDRDSIGDWLQDNRDVLFNIGPGVREEFGITDYESTSEGVYDYGALGGSGFDEDDLNDLRARNVADDIIKTLAKQAPTLGESAASSLGIDPSGEQLAEVYRQSPVGPPAEQRESTPDNPITGFGLGRGDGSGFAYENYGGGGFGLEDVRALESRGASKEDLKRIAQGAPGGQIGEGARSYLGL